MFEVKPEDIELLNDIQLVDLLKRLLLIEAEHYNLPLNSVHVPLQITVADGGEDGRLLLAESIILNGHDIPPGLMMFQVKATNIIPSTCSTEILEKSGTSLKKQVENVFNKDGTYVLFCNKGLVQNGKVGKNPTGIEPYISAFRESIRKIKGDKYAEKSKILIYDSNIIHNWVNKHLSAIATVYEYLGKIIPNGLKTWQQWSQYEQFRLPYITDEWLDKELTEVRDSLSGESYNNCCITGSSGLGKTRFALEVFREPSNLSDVDQQKLSKGAVYVDAAATYDLLANVSAWIKQGLEGTIVVDNCNRDLHKILSEEVNRRDSKLQLLTIHNYYPVYNMEPTYLKPFSRNLIHKILYNYYPKMDWSSIEKIVNYSRGYPKIALMLAKLFTKNSSISKFNEAAITEKIIWGDNQKTEEAETVISACALFDRIGFKNTVDTQYQFIAEKICKMDPDKFYAYARKYFFKRELLIEDKDYAFLAPFPIALELASNWWYECSPAKAKRLVSDILSSDLAEPFFKQLAHLNHLTHIKELITGLFNDGPLATLNMNKNSKAISYLVEIAPDNIFDLIKNSITNEIKYSQLIKETNANTKIDIIRTLFKLATHSTFFDEAALLLLKLSCDGDFNHDIEMSQRARIYFNNLFYQSNSPSVRISYLKLTRFLEANINKNSVWDQAILEALACITSFSEHDPVEFTIYEMNYGFSQFDIWNKYSVEDDKLYEHIGDPEQYQLNAIKILIAYGKNGLHLKDDAKNYLVGIFYDFLNKRFFYNEKLKSEFSKIPLDIIENIDFDKIQAQLIVDIFNKFKNDSHEMKDKQSKDTLNSDVILIDKINNIFLKKEWAAKPKDTSVVTITNINNSQEKQVGSSNIVLGNSSKSSLGIRISRLSNKAPLTYLFKHENIQQKNNVKTKFKCVPFSKDSDYTESEKFSFKP